MTNHVILHCNGTNGSTTITNDGAGSSTWAVGGIGGGGHLTTSVKKFGSASSFNGDSADSRIRSTDVGAIPTTGEWTIDFFWQWMDGGGGLPFFVNDGGIFSWWSAGVNAAIELVTKSATNKIQVQFNNGASTLLLTKTDWVLNQWYHIALVRDNNTGMFYAYIDGVLDSSMAAITLTSGMTSIDIFGLTRAGSGHSATGYIDELRISTDTCAFPGGTTFSVPTQEYTNGTAAPGAGAITLAGYAPTVDGPGMVRPLSGTLALAGYAPGLDLQIKPGVGTITFSGLVPAVIDSDNTSIEPPTGAIGLLGYSPSATIQLNTNIVPDAGAITFSGFNPNNGFALAKLTPLRTLTGHGTPVLGASVTAPLRTLSGHAINGVGGSANIDAPLRTLVGVGHQGGEFTAPLRTLDGHGVLGGFASASVNGLLRTLSAHGVGVIVANASMTAPLRVMGGGGSHGIVGRLSVSAPLRRRVLEGTAGIVGNASISGFLRTLAGRGHSQITASLAVTAPLRYTSSEAHPIEAAIFRAWALNVRTRALVEYGNFNFNSVARFGTKHLASGPDGLYVLGADNDAGSPIAALIRTGLHDFDSSHLKRVPRIYATVKSSGNLLFSTITSEDNKRTYRLVHNSITTNAAQQRRVPVNRGPKSVRWQFEIANEDGCDFAVQDILVYPVELHRRVV